MIYQTNKSGNFVFFLERFTSSWEINLFSRISFFLTTQSIDEMIHMPYSYSFYYLQFNKRNASLHF